MHKVCTGMLKSQFPQHHAENYHSSAIQTLIERFHDSEFTDRITYRQSVKLIRNLEFRAISAQLYVYEWSTPW